MEKDQEWRDSFLPSFLSSSVYEDKNYAVPYRSSVLYMLYNKPVSYTHLDVYKRQLFQFMGHTYAGPFMGATPDGRHKDEFLAHGMNPMPGRNQNGISATANSLCKIDLRHFQGGSLQIELTPIVTQTLGDTARFINHFSRVFFQKHGVQILSLIHI